MREHVSAVPHVHPRIHVLEFVDVMHEHIVIAGMITAAIELLHIPRAHGCRCDEPRIRIVGNRIRRICAVHVDFDRRFIGDLVADVRCLLAVDPDLRLRPYTADRTTERRSARIRHVIRIEDGDVFALDIEAVRLHRAEVQHVARLRRRREGACAVCLECARRCRNVSGVRRREVECARIDLRSLGEEDAVRVDEVDVPAALDFAVDVRRALACDEVQIVFCLCAAVEFYHLVLFDGEVLPLEDVVIAFARDVHGFIGSGNIRRSRIRRCVRALDGQRVSRLFGKGRGDDACENGADDGAIKLLPLYAFHCILPLYGTDSKYIFYTIIQRLYGKQANCKKWSYFIGKRSRKHGYRQRF